MNQHTNAKLQQPARKRNPALQRLDTFAGEWDVQASMEGQPLGRSRSVFEWLEGGAFLVHHATAEPAEPRLPAEWVENSPFPVTTIIGLDDSTGAYSVLYADGRGVFRVYQMSPADGVWKMWRDAPGFSQRFVATFSDDGNTLSGCWEKSEDGATWEHDFDLTYTRIL